MPVGSGPGDARLFAAAAERNRQPILDVLSRVLPDSGLALEVASGSGEHALWFAEQLYPLVWQPSDPDPACRCSIAAHGADAGFATLEAPLDLDAGAADWPIERADAVVCINMTHIAPWQATAGLIAGAVEAGLEVHGEVGSKDIKQTAAELIGQARDCLEAGAGVVGVNCSEALSVLDALEGMRESVSLPLSAQPNAGQPHTVEGRNIYLATPDYLVAW
ncbi:MAG: DUF938 domain-containing protein, partial [Proteobacteria bacterium]|nr:DUF938 domain-containing protein [Pseudomonadota bacterium]